MVNTYSTNATNDGRLASISWGAITAGAFIAFIFQVTLLSLGSGIGFTSFDPQNMSSVGKGTLITAGIYSFVTVLLSLFAGGYVSARMANYRDRSVSAPHGLCAWALVSAVTVVLLGIGVGKIAGAAIGIAGEGLRGVAIGGVDAASGAASNIDINVATVREEIKKTLHETGKKDLAPDQLKKRAGELPKKAVKAQANEGGHEGSDVVNNQEDKISDSVDREAVANVISKRLGISKEEANSLIGQSEDTANSVMANVKERLKSAGMQAAEASANAAATASWVTFISLVLGAIASYAGGLLGGPLGFGALNRRD